jgi:hypothetical protein
MGQLLHGSARTTAAVRRAIQQSQESIATLAERYHLNPKTVAKWKKRTHMHDAPMGPKTPRSTVLTLEEEALEVAISAHEISMVHLMPWRVMLGAWDVPGICPTPVQLSDGLGEHHVLAK